MIKTKIINVVLHINNLKVMNKILLITISLILSVNFSCTNSASSVKSNFDAIVIDAEKNYKNYSEDIWQKKDKEIEELTNKFNENRSKYTPQQIEDINKLIGRYSVIKVKKAGNDILEGVKTAGQMLEGAIEALTDTTK